MSSVFPGQPPVPVTSQESMPDQQNITVSLEIRPKLGAGSSSPWCQPLQGYAVKLPTCRSFWSTCQASLVGSVATCNSYGRWSGSPFSKIRENVSAANDLHAISGTNILQVADPCSTCVKTLSMKLQAVMSFLECVLCKSD